MELIVLMNSQRIVFFKFIAYQITHQTSYSKFRIPLMRDCYKTRLMKRYSTQKNVNKEMLRRKVGSKLILNTPNFNDKNQKNRSRSTIWFYPPFSKVVPTNIAKIFLGLINRYFQKSHRLYKIFNRNTVKVSYSCMQNMSKIYKVHNNKITSTPCNQLALCKC